MAWQITARPAAGSAASATIAASVDGGYVIRLRALQATLTGPSAGTALLVVRNGATGVGTIIFQLDLTTAAAGRDSISLDGLELRASASTVMTVEFTAGTATDEQSVNAQGDYVPIGQPWGQ